MTEDITAFLLHSRDFQNNSIMLDFLTDDFGLIRLILRGGKNKKNYPQQFCKMQISFAGSGNLKTLKNYEITDSYREIATENLLLLIYINEIILKFVNDSPIKICQDYYYLLTHLNNDKNNNYWLIRIFENKLLTELGFAIDFNNDIIGNKINPKEYYCFLVNQGFKLSKTKDILGSNILKMAKDIILDEDGLRDYKKINRIRINQLLNGRTLRTRDLFKTLIVK